MDRLVGAESELYRLMYRVTQNLRPEGWAKVNKKPSPPQLSAEPFTGTHNGVEYKNGWAPLPEGFDDFLRGGPFQERTDNNE